MKTSIQTIQPLEAVQYLETVQNNRKVNRAHVTTLGNTLKDNRWMVNGESIKFAIDENGNNFLIDGQHRLRAVVASDTPITTVVIEGLDPEAFVSLDSGKRRSLADVLTILDYPHPSVLSGALNILEKYYSSGIGSGGASTASLSNERAENLMHQYPTLVQSADVLTKMTSTNPVSPTISTAMHYVFANLEPSKDKLASLGEQRAKLDQVQDADSFWLKFGRGLNLTEDCPIRRFREILLEHRRMKRTQTRYYITSGLVKAWNHWRKGTQLKRFYHQPDGKSASFPQPK